MANHNTPATTLVSPRSNNLHDMCCFRQYVKTLGPDYHFQLYLSEFAISTLYAAMRSLWCVIRDCLSYCPHHFSITARPDGELSKSRLDVSCPRTRLTVPPDSLRQPTLQVQSPASRRVCGCKLQKVLLAVVSSFPVCLFATS